MNIRHMMTSLIGSVVLLTASPLLAASVSAPMRVSVQVIARAIVTVNGQQTINVTVADVARGYVDLMTPLVLNGRTNSRNGYLLQVEKTNETFEKIDLKFPNATVNLSSPQAWIQRPYVPGGEVVPVSARLFLAPGVMPGAYALPVSFSGSPL